MRSKMAKGLTISPLEADDAAKLCALLRSQSASFVRFFSPFAFEEKNIGRLLRERDQDVWVGIEWQNNLIGFFMLRGWDAGYEVPAYGVLIAEDFNGYGFASLSLKIAKAIAKLRRVPRLMLKVHPENVRARQVFEHAKFKLTGVDAESGNLIYHFDLPRRATKS